MKSEEKFNELIELTNNYDINLNYCGENFEISDFQPCSLEKSYFISCSDSINEKFCITSVSV